MIRPILKYGDQILHDRAVPVGHFTTEIDRLIADMIETMYVAPGIGLAAPQVGVALRIFVVNLSLDHNPTNLIIIITPKFIKHNYIQLKKKNYLNIPDF